MRLYARLRPRRVWAAVTTSVEPETEPQTLKANLATFQTFRTLKVKLGELSEARKTSKLGKFRALLNTLLVT